MATRVPRHQAGIPAVSLWQALRDAFSEKPRWDAARDTTIEYLREQVQEAERKTRLLREERTRRERFPIADMIRREDR